MIMSCQFLDNIQKNLPWFTANSKWFSHNTEIVPKTMFRVAQAKVNSIKEFGMIKRRPSQKITT